jgi:ribonuclease R
VSIHNLMAKDEFKHDESEYALIGLRTGRKFRIGDKVTIRVVAANMAKRQLDYDLAEELTPARPAKGGKAAREKRKEKPPAKAKQPARGRAPKRKSS